MLLQTNMQNIFFGRLVFLYALLILFLTSNNISSINGQNKDDWTSLTQTKQKDVDDSSVVSPLTVIPEQDPNGIYWGLRDTTSGKLVLNYTYQKINEFKNGFAIVMLNGKFGLISKRGKQIIEPVYNFPKTQLQCGIIAFEYGYGPVIVFDTIGKPVMPMVYGMTGLLPYQKRITYGHYQYGMRNFSGDTILPFKFTYTQVIPEGFCIASKPVEKDYNRLYGLYDLNGKQVLPHDFESIDGFYCGRAIVKKKGKYGVIDETGMELFYTEYGRIDRFYNDYAIVYKNHENGDIKVGIIDKKGLEVVPAIYQWLDQVYNFSEGLAAVAQNRKYGFVDTKGKVVIPFKYDNVNSFQNGIAKVWVNGWRNVAYINRNGEEIIPPIFEAINQSNLRRYHNKFIIGLKDSAHYVFDYSGKEIALLQYETVGEFNEYKKSFLVSKNNKWGTLDSNLQVEIPIEYEFLETIFPDKIAATKNGKIGFINHEGKVISSFEYDWISPFMDDYIKKYENGLAKVGISGKNGLINGYGKLIIPVIYDEIQDFSHGLAVVKRDNKYGFVDLKGKEIIPPIYDEANSYKGYSAEVSLMGETFQIDSSGKRMVEDH